MRYGAAASCDHEHRVTAAQLQEVVLPRPPGEVDATAGTALSPKRRQIRLNRSRGDRQTLGYLRISQAVCREPKHVELASRQRRLLRSPQSRHRIDEVDRQRWTHRGCAGMNVRDGVEELLDRGAFCQISRCARVE